MKKLVILGSVSALTVALIPVLALSTLFSSAADSANASATDCVPGTTATVKIPTLDKAQVQNATTIDTVGTSLKISTFGVEIAIAVAYQESKLHNLASEAVPESKAYPHDAVAPGDHDSVGLFQQRANWGSVVERMTPAVSADKFFSALSSVHDWQHMALTDAAQAVQGSAAPDAYAQWETLAKQVVAGLSGHLAMNCTPDVSVSIAGKVGVAINHALKARNTSYSFGGSCTDPQSTNMALHCDCSSLVQQAWLAAGVTLPRTSEAQYNAVAKVAGIDASNVIAKAQPGMLLFYNWGEDGQAGPGHVALALGSGYLIEAPQPGEDVHIIKIYTNSFVSAGQVG
jgi:cell wall-associated NlpC family hydrolase